jgi:hypothetical protein
MIRFIVDPLFPCAVSFLTPIFSCTRPKYRTRVSAHGCLLWRGPLGPKVGTEGVMSPSDGQSRLRPPGAMTEVLLGQGRAALPPDSGSREAPYEGINYRAPGPGA